MPALSSSFRGKVIDVVADYGGNQAINNGVIDATESIRAALVAAAADGTATGGSFFGTVIYFEPGAYKITSQIDLRAPGSNASIRLAGASKEATMIFGNVAGGYIFSRADATNSVDCIEHMMIKNTNTSAGSGALKFLNAQQGRLDMVSLQGFNALDVSSNVYNTTCINCDFSCTPGNGSGTVGVYAGQAHFFGCSVSGCSVGVQASNAGFVWIGGRLEVNGDAFVLGLNKAGDLSNLAGALIAGFTTEGNIRDFYIASVKGSQIGPGTCTGVIGEAHDNGVLSTIRPNGSDGLTATSTIYVKGANALKFVGLDVSTKTVTAAVDMSDVSLDAGNVTFDSCRAFGTANASGTGVISGTTLTISGAVTNLFAVGMVISGSGVTGGTTIVRQITGTLGIAGTYEVSASQTVASTTITGAGGVAWKMPVTSKNGIEFFNSNNTTAAYLFHDLPGEAGFGAPPTAVEGMEFDITDSNTATWGATAAAGGSNHVRVRYNGTNWTVVGK